jgi:hypothetical protein
VPLSWSQIHPLNSSDGEHDDEGEGNHIDEVLWQSKALTIHDEAEISNTVNDEADLVGGGGGGGESSSDRGNIPGNFPTDLNGGISNKKTSRCRCARIQSSSV